MRRCIWVTRSDLLAIRLRPEWNSDNDGNRILAWVVSKNLEQERVVKLQTNSITMELRFKTERLSV